MRTCRHQFVSLRSGVLLAALLAAGPTLLPAAESKPLDPRQKAIAAQRAGKPAEALTLANQAITADGKNPQNFYTRGWIYAEQRQPTNAVADFDRALQLDPGTAMTYQHRGGERFKLGQIREALADFDKAIELEPSLEPHNWQRGIAQYYAGRFADGRKQFEVHQTVNRNDVENAVWHFLCVARLDGIEKARAALIPIDRDGRVPMMQVHALFAGKSTPDDVLAVAKEGATGERLREQLFYAHLYLGLYYEALGDTKKTREHILKAADDFPSTHYMGEVARVHARRLRSLKP